MNPYAAVFASPVRPAPLLRQPPPWGFTVALYALATVGYAALPLLSSDLREDAALGIAVRAVLVIVLNLLYVLILDLTLDPKVQKKQMRALMHRTLCTSAAFTLVTGAAASAALAGRPVLAAALAAAIWWQWMIEAVTVRALYGLRYPAAFGVVVAMRLLATVVGGIIAYALVAQVGQLVNWGISV